MTDKNIPRRRRRIIEHIIDEALYLAGAGTAAFGIYCISCAGGIIAAGVGLLCYGLFIRRPLI